MSVDGCAFFEVFPTPVGVFLFVVPKPLDARRLPHACGGVSEAIGKPQR